MMLLELPHRRSVPSAPLVASVVAEDRATVVTLRGEADLFTLPVVVDVLARAIAESDGPVIVDLSETGFIDTATVRVLARAWHYLDEHGRPLTLRSPAKVAARVLELLGLSHLIEPDRLTAA